MAEKIQLEIVSSTEVPFKASIKELYIPAYNGEAGILENHKPYVTLLQPGEVFYTDIHDKKSYLYVRDGFIEVNDNNVVIISDTVEKGEALDKAEIEAKLADLEKQIKALQDKDMNAEDLQAAPDKFKAALAEQREFDIKKKIIAKIEKAK
jgi:F-type H+-transporting ATPase subunit epsilon